MMNPDGSPLHYVYLNLGSNIEPEKNIPRAIELLKEVTKVESVSSVWETKSVGYDGENFLNMCVLIFTNLQPDELKNQILRPVENQVGRVRNENRYAPRTIDIDIILFDETPHNLETWNHAFVIIPLAELIPNFVHPLEAKSLVEVAKQIHVWIMKRDDVVIS
ncbi:MAG TPA: 2-amino-4-hydroxy-6-hydroxymethyldihydropteridine diphosphokinase [Anaerolineae bacterium]|nr:2-amino-4-hydroxy-6-hydroxymethyldihydropteridine diphosphokinase [Anaerolineae bacterium]HCK65680.1 2-amino-4-hydroxy-6-hydroxymethyldihydropteridine diphosphokinase [Anaerolineae bacterium]